MEIKEIINLTPHMIKIFRKEDTEIDLKTSIRTLKNWYAEPILEIESKGHLRLKYESKLHNDLRYNGVNIPILSNTSCMQIDYMPEEKPGTIYIISALVAKELKAKGIKRRDLYTVNGVLRNERGGIFGCTSFAAVM